MKLFILFFTLTLFLSASPLDEYNFYMANKIYKQGKYKKALQAYQELEPKGDRVYYNIANTLYRLGEYQKAIEYYKLVEGVEYNAKKLYNIGNAYVMQKNYLKAIIFYKNALKFSQDKQIKENLLYAQSQNRALQSVMLKGAKCSVTKGEVLDFDDENVSKDMQEAKYKNEPKFNVLDRFKLREDDLAEVGNDKKSDKNSTQKVEIKKDLILMRAKESLKSRGSKVLLIPVGDEK
ncbi:MAG TPA: tetratricopeptide repeat protein [Nitratifractor sp.]|nr:tetratricopeptide repeat protein [Nitratifractor sp.]